MKTTLYQAIARKQPAPNVSIVVTWYEDGTATQHRHITNNNRDTTVMGDEPYYGKWNPDDFYARVYPDRARQAE